MTTIRNTVLASAVLALAACSSMGGMSGGHTSHVALSGSQEVPPVNTGASGSADITVGDDGSVSGKITTAGINGVAAHIHQGAPGANGPVIVPFEKAPDGSWAPKAGAKLNEAQMAAYKAGNTYVNVHSPQNKGGEIRGQVQP
jgi:hypothetical protein